MLFSIPSVGEFETQHVFNTDSGRNPQTKCCSVRFAPLSIRPAAHRTACCSLLWLQNSPLTRPVLPLSELSYSYYILTFVIVIILPSGILSFQNSNTFTASYTQISSIYRNAIIFFSKVIFKKFYIPYVFIVCLFYFIFCFLKFNPRFRSFEK
jgi:hypothetical protein